MELSTSKFKRSNSLHNIIFIMKVTLARSIELLTELAELQNGPPLVKYEKQWNETMENVWEFIHNYEKRFENVPIITNIWDKNIKTK